MKSLIALEAVKSAVQMTELLHPNTTGNTLQKIESEIEQLKQETIKAEYPLELSPKFDGLDCETE